MDWTKRHGEPAVPRAPSRARERVARLTPRATHLPGLRPTSSGCYWTVAQSGRSPRNVGRGGGSTQALKTALPRRADAAVLADGAAAGRGGRRCGARSGGRRQSTRDRTAVGRTRRRPAARGPARAFASERPLLAGVATQPNPPATTSASPRQARSRPPSCAAGVTRAETPSRGIVLQVYLPSRRLRLQREGFVLPEVVIRRAVGDACRNHAR